MMANEAPVGLDWDKLLGFRHVASYRVQVARAAGTLFNKLGGETPTIHQDALGALLNKVGEGPANS
jgi:hypothetical protein